MGGLTGSLNPLQALGIWPSGDFRVNPSGSVVTAILVALGIFSAVLGFWAAWQKRSLATLLLATSLLAAVAIVAFGSPWVDGEALATAAPAVLALAIAGAASTLQLDRVTGFALIAVVAGGVLWSNILAYGGVNLAPTTSSTN